MSTAGYIKSTLRRRLSQVAPPETPSLVHGVLSPSILCFKYRKVPAAENTQYLHPGTPSQVYQTLKIPSVPGYAGFHQGLSTLPPPPQTNQPKTASRKRVIQRLMIGFRLREAPYMGDIGENEPKRGTSQLAARFARFFTS